MLLQLTGQTLIEKTEDLWHLPKGKTKPTTKRMGWRFWRLSQTLLVDHTADGGSQMPYPIARRSLERCGDQILDGCVLGLLTKGVMIYGAISVWSLSEAVTLCLAIEAGSRGRRRGLWMTAGNMLVLGDRLGKGLPRESPVKSENIVSVDSLAANHRRSPLP